MATRKYTRRAPRPQAMRPTAPVQASTETVIEAAPTVPRPEPRPEMRAAPRDANARAAELLGQVDFTETEDKFDLPKTLAPDGWEYEWKTATVLGKDEVQHQLYNVQKGWEPVPANRHAGLMPVGAQGAVTREGMVLMERPKIVNDRVRQIEYERARSQVNGQTGKLLEAQNGQFDRTTTLNPNSPVRTEYRAPMAVPE